MEINRFLVSLLKLDAAIPATQVSFCPVVWIGSPLTCKRVCLPHPGPGGDTLACWEGRNGVGGDPIPTTGQKLWYSLLYNPFRNRVNKISCQFVARQMTLMTILWKRQQPAICSRGPIIIRPCCEYLQHGLITIKTPNPKCRLYWCLREFIDWRYSQSCWYFRPAL